MRNFLARYCPEVTLVGEADGVAEGVKLLGQTKPDVMFLDIRMNDGNGFDLLEKIEQVSAAVVFTTAYDEYALKAFKYHALDYLLKPIDPEELMATVKRIQHSQTPSTERLNALYENRGRQQFETLVLPGFDEFRFVKIENIVRVEADANYSKFHFVDGERIVASSPLKEYEQLLPEATFFRIHQSHLINLKFVAKFHKTDGGYVEMQNGNSIPVSRRKKSVFLDRIRKGLI